MSKSARTRTHRVYQPGKRRMELMPSVSRSSGLEKGGDALRDHKVQEEYRAFIQGKVDAYWEEFPYGIVSVNEKQRDEVRGNLLILFRKLREGLLSTKRMDNFALEVYETSLHLSVIFNSPAQTTSIASHLLPDLYRKAPEHPQTASSSTLVSALHLLVAGYPSQTRCSEHLDSLPSVFLPKGTPAHRWLSDVMRALRSRNFARFESLSTDDKIQELFPEHKALTSTNQTQCPPLKDKSRKRPEYLPLAAFLTLVDALREKARETTWLVIRSAYRELHCTAQDGDGNLITPSPTSQWLYQSLSLRSVVTKPLRNVDGGTYNGGIDSTVSDWLEGKCAQGEVRAREGVEGRWLICKVAAK